MNKRIIRGYLFVIASAIIFGCMPLMAKHVYADGVNSITLVFLRNLFSLPVLAVLAFIESRSLKISLGTFPKIAIISAIGYVLTPYLLFTSYDHMDSGAATVLHFVYPAAVVLIELICFKKGVGLAGIIGLSLFVCGIPLFYTPGADIGLTGSIISIASGITYAVYIVMISRLKPSNGGFAFCFYLAIFATVTLFIIAVSTGQLSMPKSPLAWILSVVFGFVVNGGAMMFFQRGAYIIGGSRASILSAIEPVTSLVVGALFLSENIGLLAVIGSVLIISAGVVTTVFDKKKAESCAAASAQAGADSSGT